MCDNKNNCSCKKKDCSSDEFICSKDSMGCNKVTMSQISQNNLCLKDVFKSIRCSMLEFIANVSESFANVTTASKDIICNQSSFNSYIEALATAMHSAVQIGCEDFVRPSFAFYVQKKDVSGNNIYSLYDEIDDKNNITVDGSTPPLYPTKLAIIHGCNFGKGGTEVLYYWIPSFQLLYDPTTSQLDIRVGFSEYHVTQSNLGCLFPGIIDPSEFTYKIHRIVPPMEEGLSWDEQQDIYEYVKNIIVDNDALVGFVGLIDTVIKRSDIAHSSIRLRQRLDKLC